MSTAVVSFKQPCPGCGAHLTLKSSLAGKKVDCPKCKFRFIVEAPSEEDTAVEEKKPAKGKEKDTKAKAKGKEKGKDKGKGDKDTPKKKNDGKSKMPLILAGVGILVLIGVGVGIMMMMNSGTSKTPATTNRTPNNGGPVADQGGGGGGQAGQDDPATDQTVNSLQNPQERDNAKRLLFDMLKDPNTRQKALRALRKAALNLNDWAVEFMEGIVKEDKNHDVTTALSELLQEVGAKPAAKGGGLTGAKNDPTNLLPANTQTVLFLDVRKITDSDFAKAIFTIGSYRKEDFRSRLGLSVDNIEQVVIGCNRDHNHVVGIVRTISLMNWDDVRKALQIEGDGITVAGSTNAGTYYKGKVDFLTEFLSNRMKPIVGLRDKAAIYKLNDYTLVYGNEAAIEDYIKNPPTIPETPKEQPQKPDTPAQGSGGGGAPPPAGGGDGPSTMNAGGGGGQTNPPPAGGGGNDGPGVMSGGGGGQPGNIGGGGPPQIGGGGNQQQQQKPKPPPEKEGRFLTLLDGALHNIIKMSEDGKDSFGLIADSASKKDTSVVDWVLFLRDLEPVDRNRIRCYSVAVRKDDTLRLRAAIQVWSKPDSPTIHKKLDTMLTAATKGELRDLLGIELNPGAYEPPPEKKNDAPTLGGGPGNANPPGANVGGGNSGMPPRAGVGGGTSGAPAGGGMPPRAGVGGGSGAASVGGDGPAAMGGNNPGNNRGGGNQFNQDNRPDDNLETGRRDEYITVDIIVRTDPTKLIEDRIAAIITKFYSLALLKDGWRGGDLAYAAQMYMDSNKTLPNGIFPRSGGAARGDRPYPPHEHVSFLCEFLPYLGDERMLQIRNGIKASSSWRDPDNLRQGRILIPQFLHPDGGPQQVKINSVDQYLAATHIVGMAGVGPDAAYLPKGHPDAGVFGYYRQTTMEDLRLGDGASNTIMLIQTDPALIGPWIAGGGYTVRGTSPGCDDVGKPGGFSSPAYKGKQGVWVVMGDGSARYLTKGISPSVFRSLCTIWGRDTTKDIDLIAPREDLPVSQKAKLKTPTEEKKPPTKIVEEEEEKKPTKPADPPK